MIKKSKPRKGLNRQQKRDLDIEIGFLEGVIRRDPGYLEALQILGDDYTRRGKFLEGLKIDESLALLRPDDSLVHYNLACSYSLTDQFDRTLKSLETALACGYRDFKWLAEDPDLEAFREQTSYSKIKLLIRGLKAKATRKDE